MRYAPAPALGSSIMTTSSSDTFYDSLAEFYDLIFEDWGASMQRQGRAIAELISRLLPDATPPIRVLDAAAGIGTQSLPLAELGFELTCRDLSAAAIARLQREARSRSLTLDAGVADMRSVDQSVSAAFDVAIAFDNSLAHLLDDTDILAAFLAIFRSLRPGGLCLFSVRDYETVTRGADAVHAYGVRWRDGMRHLPLQVWRWLGDSHYDATFHVVVEGETASVHSVTTRFHAFSVSRLLDLLAQAGFEDCRRFDETVYQPIISAKKPGSGPSNPSTQ